MISAVGKENIDTVGRPTVLDGSRDPVGRIGLLEPGSPNAPDFHRDGIVFIEHYDGVVNLSSAEELEGEMLRCSQNTRSEAEPFSEHAGQTQMAHGIGTSLQPHSCVRSGIPVERETWMRFQGTWWHGSEKHPGCMRASTLPGRAAKAAFAESPVFLSLFIFRTRERFESTLPVRLRRPRCT